MVVEPSLQDESEFLYTAQPELLRYKTAQLAVEKVIDWYQTRAEEIEHHARQVRARDSCCSAMAAGLPGSLGFSVCVAADSAVGTMWMAGDG